VEKGPWISGVRNFKALLEEGVLKNLGLPSPLGIPGIWRMEFGSEVKLGSLKITHLWTRMPRMVELVSPIISRPSFLRAHFSLWDF